jgi:hypothetical protein
MKPTTRVLVLGLACLSVTTAASSGAEARSFEAAWQRMQDAAPMPAGPGKRVWTDLAWDSYEQRFVVIGGAGSGTYLNDIWRYDPRSDRWTNVVPQSKCPGHTGFSGPDGRDTQAVEYDPVGSDYWMLGGGGYKCGPLASRTAAAGTTSTRLVDPTLPSNVRDHYRDWSVTVGTKRVYVTAYDPATRSLTLAQPITALAAGSSYKLQVWTNGYTWKWSSDGRAWTGIDHPHWYGSVVPPPSPTAAGRTNAATAYSTSDERVVLFGGGRNGGRNDTWALDPRYGRWAEMKPHSTTNPILARSELTGAMVYDSWNDVFVLFGGRCSDNRCAPSGRPLGDTWVYHLPTNTWRQMSPAVSPPARMQHNMAFDAKHGVAVLFGGIKADSYVGANRSQANVLADLWTYDYRSNTWTQVAQSAGPSRRYNATMAFAPGPDVSVLYSGTGFTSAGRLGALAEVWQLRLVER